MQSHSRRVLGFLLLSITTLILAWAASAQQPKSSATPRRAPSGKLAEEVFKNIKSLKGQPANQLIPTMQFMSSSLGVDCSFCHDVKAFEKDDKDEKRTAREMIAMQQSINRVHFKGKREVTCNSCHHGEMHPAAAPALAELNTPVPVPIEGHEHHMEGPAAHSHDDHDHPASPTEYLDAFLQASGGEAALANLTSRTARGTVNFGSGPASSFESYTRATGQRATTLTIPEGQAISTFDGHAGFLIYPGHHPRQMSAGEIEAARVEADFEFPANFKQQYSQFRIARPEKINGTPANVLQASRPGQPPVRLYFDPTTKMLIRVLYYIETPLGRNPTRIDILHYDQSGGVQLPSQWIITRPASRATYTVESSNNAAPIPDTKFNPPATTEAVSTH